MNNEKDEVMVTQLSSGARLISVQNSLPISMVAAWYRAGGRFDPVGKEGLAHFFEHLLMRKTKTYPNQQQLVKARALNGIRYNATTTRETACYYFEQPADKTLAALDFLLDGAYKSIIDPADVEQEKGPILDEEASRFNNARRHILSLNHAALWPNGSLGRPLLGTEQSIRAITFNDIELFRQNCYTEEEAVFVVVGKHDVEEVKKKIEQASSGKKARTRNAVFDDAGNNTPTPLSVHRREINQAIIAVNFKTTAEKNHADAVVLDLVVNYYLTNTWISRLMQKMRLEKNFTYSVDGSTETFADTGFASIIFTTAPDDINKSLEIVSAEIDNLKSGKLSEEDFNGAKILARADFLRKTINPQNITWWYGWQTVTGEKIYSIEQYVQSLMNVTIDDIRRVAKKYFMKDNCAIVVVGHMSNEAIKFNWK